MQGESIVPVLKGDTKNWRKSVYYAYYEIGEPSGIHTTQHRVEADADTLCQDMKMFPNPGGIQQDAAIQRNDLIHDGLRVLIESRWDSLVLGKGHRVSLVPRSTLCWVVQSRWDS